MEARKTPPIIVLFPVRAREKRAHEEWREQAWRQAEIDLVKLAALGPAAIDHVNASLIDAFDERILYAPVTRAWPLEGGADAWKCDIERAMARITDPLGRELRGEMVGGGDITGRVLNRKRILVSNCHPRRFDSGS